MSAVRTSAGGATPHEQRQTRGSRSALLLLGGLGVAVCMRVLVGGPSVAVSTPAAWLFAVTLAGLALGSGWRPGRPRLGGLGLGGATAVALVLVTALHSPLPVHPLGPPPDARLAAWAPAVVAVAVSEEWLLRGALFDALRDCGDLLTVTVGAAAFALIHLPLYGVGSLPLDLGVGVLLGGLRLLSGGAGAPAVAHSLADLASWGVP